MMLSMLSVIALSSSTTLACDNNAPISERHPGWTDSKAYQLIDFEVFYDLTWSGSAAMQPELKKFLDMPFLGSSLRDAITVNYAFFPLPYHHVSWIPHKMIPYTINKCLKDTIGCKMPY